MPNMDLIDATAETHFGQVQSLVTAIRSIRAEYGVKPGTSVHAFCEPADGEARDAFEAERGTIERLAKLDALVFGAADETVGAHAVLADGSAVFVPLGDAIDIQAECVRLASEMKRLEKQLAAVTAKLANENFTTRAPAEVVERERQKEQAWGERRDTLAAKRRSLGCS